jgi:hypothetical protein
MHFNTHFRIEGRVRNVTGYGMAYVDGITGVGTHTAGTKPCYGFIYLSTDQTAHDIEPQRSAGDCQPVHDGLLLSRKLLQAICDQLFERRR